MDSDTLSDFRIALCVRVHGCGSEVLRFAPPPVSPTPFPPVEREKGGDSLGGLLLR